MRAPKRGLVALAAALSLTLAACGDDAEDDVASPGGDDGSEQTAEVPAFASEITSDGLVVGTKFDQPLFGLKGLSGEPEGFDVEVAKIIGERLGVNPDEIEFVETVSANREPFIEQGKVDFVVATYTINDKRDKVIDFAGPYFQAGQDILVAEGNPEGLQGQDDLAGKKVCSVSGSTPANFIQENVPNAELVLFDTYSKCRDALQNGQVQAVTTDNVILAGFVNENPDEFDLVGNPFTEEPYGIGVAEGSELCPFINDVLAEAAESGELQEAFDRTAGEFIERDITPLGEPRGCDT
jgi:glutamate transport system substrate-binding protein